MNDAVVVLRDEAALDLCSRLLRDESWRQRLVEQVHPLSSDHYRLSRSYQFDLPSDLWADAGIDLDDGHVPVRAILPICWLPKRPLLDFDLSDQQGTSIALLERRSIAAITAEAVWRWQDEVPLPAEAELDLDLLESICVASLVVWERLLEDAGGDRPRAADEYVHAGTGITLAQAVIDQLLAKADGLKDKVESLDLPSVYGLEITTKNSAVNPVLLAPHLYPAAGTAEELAERLLDAAQRIGRLLEAVRDDERVVPFAAAVINAGHWWPALGWVDVPVGQPFLVKLEETRVSGHKRPSHLLHEAALADARSYHLQARSPAPAIAIRGKPRVEVRAGVPVDLLFEGARASRELFTAYTSLPARPPTARFRFRFRLGRALWVAYAFAFALALAALFAALIHPDLRAPEATLLTVPTTVVSGLLLATGPRLLADFLRKPQVALVAVNSSVWAASLWRVVMAD